MHVPEDLTERPSDVPTYNAEQELNSMCFSHSILYINNMMVAQRKHEFKTVCKGMPNYRFSLLFFLYVNSGQL